MCVVFHEQGGKKPRSTDRMSQTDTMSILSVGREPAVVTALLIYTFPAKASCS